MELAHVCPALSIDNEGWICLILFDTMLVQLVALIHQGTSVIKSKKWDHSQALDLAHAYRAFCAGAARMNTRKDPLTMCLVSPRPLSGVCLGSISCWIIDHMYKQMERTDLLPKWKQRTRGEKEIVKYRKGGVWSIDITYIKGYSVLFYNQITTLSLLAHINTLAKSFK